MAIRQRQETNRLLANLPKQERERFVSSCEPVDLAFGEIVAQAGKSIDHVYFPLGALISLLRPVDGQSVEVAIAGDDGMLGVSLSAGVDVSNVRAVVQGKGTALRMSRNRFKRHLERSAALRNQMGRYTVVLMTQIAQTAACNRFHVVEQRLCRWLLMTADRAHSLSFRVTHEFLAHMLGVRRAGVTSAAGTLQRRGLIQYKRGHIEILDRRGLERASCGCYRNSVETYESVMR